MELQKEISEYYKKLAEVYIYGLACSDCPNKKRNQCAGYEELCAKRLQSTMKEIMNENF